MSSWRRHSEQLERAIDDQQQQQPSATNSRHRGQPLVRTRSSAQLLLGQLTGTCSSLLRRLSVKVRYLSLSLIPTATTSPSGSRHTSPSGRERPRSADRSGPSGSNRTQRPRRHTTTVITTTPAMMNESTPVLARGPSPHCPRGRQSLSPGSDSEATPTPSPCHFQSTASHVQQQLDDGDEVLQSPHYLKTDDYATLKASSGSSSGRRRRRHHQGGSSESHHRNNQTERRTGSYDPSQQQPAPMTVITAPLLLAPDQPFSGLLDLNLNGAKCGGGGGGNSGYLAPDQQQQQLDRRRMASSAELVGQSGQESTTGPKSNPYLDWYFNCSSSGSGSGGQKEMSDFTTSVPNELNKSLSQKENEILIDDLPYPILLDEWLASPPRSPKKGEGEGEGGNDVEDVDEEEEEDPLEALEHHTSWFEEFAYPAYSSAKTSSAGAAKSHGGGSGGATTSSCSSGRVMTEKAYPYVSSPVSPRTKQRQMAPYDPYDLLLYDESVYLETAASLLDPADEDPITPTVLKPVPTKSHPIPSTDNNSERGVHPGPESLPPGLDSNAFFTGSSGGLGCSRSTNNNNNNNINKSNSVNAPGNGGSSCSSKLAAGISVSQNASATVSLEPCLTFV